MKWLVTAFEPFGGAQSNSSLIAAKALAAMDWQGQVEFYFPVPVQFTTAWTAVRKALSKFPDVTGVLALGQAETRERISLEHVAINWADVHSKDNLGFKPAIGRIEKGPDAIFTTIPWERLEDSPHWVRSYSAGAYVCNTLMYQLLLHSGKRAGFVHLPALTSQGEPQYEKHPRMADAVAIESLVRVVRFLVDLKE